MLTFGHGASVPVAAAEELLDGSADGHDAHDDELEELLLDDVELELDELLDELLPRKDALSAVDAIDSSLASIDETRVKWGANMNRLVHAGDVSSNVSLNLDDSRSKIVDADYAKATADLAKAQILQMAGKAMLSQANQAPISVLRLLR